MITFKQLDLLGSWLVQVYKHGVHVGNIRRTTPDSGYAYYVGKDNQLTAFLKSASLDELKKAIKNAS